MITNGFTDSVLKKHGYFLSIDAFPAQKLFKSNIPLGFLQTSLIIF